MLKKLKLQILLVSILFTMTNCEQNELFKGDQTEVNLTKSTSEDISVEVNSWNGMLEFNSVDEFEQYKLEMELFLDEYEESYEPTDKDFLIPNTYLDNLEKSLGYTSLRKLLEIREIDLLRSGVNPIDGEFNYHFIADTVMRHVLNSELEVKVGHSIYKFIDKNHWIEITNTNMETLEMARSANPATYHQEGLEVHTIGSAVFKIAGVNSLCQASIFVTVPDDCLPNKVKVQMGFVYTPNPNYMPTMQWNINWGDGTSTSFIGTRSETRYHTYTSGSTNMLLYVQGTDMNATWCYDIDGEFIDFQFNPVCDNNERSDSFGYYINSTQTQSYLGRIWGDKSGSIKKIGAETKFYKKISGTWRHRNADLLGVKIWADWWTGGCGQTFHSEYHENWNRSNKKTVRRTFSSHGMWEHEKNAIYALFRAENNGNSGQHTIYLPAINCEE